MKNNQIITQFNSLVEEFITTCNKSNDKYKNYQIKLEEERQKEHNQLLEEFKLKFNNFINDSEQVGNISCTNTKFTNTDINSQVFNTVIDDIDKRTNYGRGIKEETNSTLLLEMKKVIEDKDNPSYSTLRLMLSKGGIQAKELQKCMKYNKKSFIEYLINEKILSTNTKHVSIKGKSTTVNPFCLDLFNKLVESLTENLTESLNVEEIKEEPKDSNESLLTNEERGDEMKTLVTTVITEQKTYDIPDSFENKTKEEILEYIKSEDDECKLLDEKIGEEVTVEPQTNKTEVQKRKEQKEERYSILKKKYMSGEDFTKEEHEEFQELKLDLEGNLYNNSSTSNKDNKNKPSFKSFSNTNSNDENRTENKNMDKGSDIVVFPIEFNKVLTEEEVSKLRNGYSEYSNFLDNYESCSNDDLNIDNFSKLFFGFDKVRVVFKSMFTKLELDKNNYDTDELKVKCIDIWKNIINNLKKYNESGLDTNISRIIVKDIKEYINNFFKMFDTLVRVKNNDKRKYFGEGNLILKRYIELVNKD